MPNDSGNQVSRPLSILLPSWGIVFAESIHSPDFKMDWASDPHFKLIYVLRGAVTIQYQRTDQKSFSYSTGSFIAFHRNLMHKVVDQVPATLLLLRITHRLLKQFPDSSMLWKSILTRQNSNLSPPPFLRDQIENLWRASIWEQQSNQMGNSLTISANAFRILTLLGRSPPRTDKIKSTDRVKSTIQKLSLTFYEEWSIERACHESSLSRRRFCYLFKKATGQTFLDRLTALRLDYAAKLLTINQSSIAGAAFSSGYQDLSHFYRVFKQKFGTSPGQWKDKKPRR
jgi:AraC-like DNA-binding protein